MSGIILNKAENVYLGEQTADAIFVGAEKVWPITTTYAERIKSLHPLNYWRLGEAAGSSVAIDEMGVHDGTYTTNPTLGVPGLLARDNNTAMQVAAVPNQGMTLGPNAPEQAVDIITLEAWVKTPNPGSGYRSIAVKLYDVSLFAIDGFLGCYVWSTYQSIHTEGALADDMPHHVLGVFVEGVTDGSRLYVDGVAVGAPFSWSTAYKGDSLDVGYNTGGYDQDWDGIIDEVAFYDYALSSADILTNYQVGMGI